jgi:hypothetical protein
MAISRNTKTGGGTSVNTGAVWNADDINGDMDTLFNKFNSGILNADVAAGAAIAYSKLNLANSIVSADIVNGTIVNGDIADDTILNAKINSAADITLTKLGDTSANAAGAATAVDPGVTNSESLATTGEGEIHRLRYAIERQALGIDATRFDATGTAETTYWGDLPVRELQWIPGINGVVTAGLPAGWANVNTATLAQEAADAADKTAGKGRAIKITAAGSANEGMSYTLSGLKSATRYAIYALVKATAGDTAKLTTTGANAASDFRDITATTTSTGWTFIGGVVQTDATPTNIVVSVLAAADTDIVWCAGVCWGECSATPLAQRVAVVEYLSGSTAGTQVIDAGSDAGIDAGYRIIESGTTDFDVTVYVPGDGYYIEVDAQFNGEDTVNDTTAQTMTVKLYQSVNGGAFSAVNTLQVTRDGTSSGRTQNYWGNLGHVVKTPNPGQSYRYLIAATRDDHNITMQKDSSQTTYLKVKVLPYGG